MPAHLAATVRNASISRPESVSLQNGDPGSPAWPSAGFQPVSFHRPRSHHSNNDRQKYGPCPTCPIFSFNTLRNSGIGIPLSSGSSALRRALMAERRKLASVTPGIATGYWNARNKPARERSSGAISQDINTVLTGLRQQVTFVHRVAHQAVGQGRLSTTVRSH